MKYVKVIFDQRPALSLKPMIPGRLIESLGSMTRIP
jgi:hypothetical protein